MKPGCKEAWTDEVTVDKKAPFGIFVQQNYPDGWNDPICLMCSNQDETKTIDIVLNQLSCVESKNCPSGDGKTPGKAPVAGAGQCKGHLLPISNPVPITIPFDDASNSQLYTRLDAQGFFTNDDP